MLNIKTILFIKLLILVNIEGLKSNALSIKFSRGIEWIRVTKRTWQQRLH